MLNNYLWAKIFSMFKNLNESYGKMSLIYLCLLFLGYSPVLLFQYGFLDDYYMIDIEQRFTNMGSVFFRDLSEGRPILGILRGLAVQFMPYNFTGLLILRWLSFGILTAYALFLFWFIQKRAIFKSGWITFFFPLLIVLLPSYQISVAWAVCFAYGLAGLFAGISYWLISEPKKTGKYYFFSYLCLSLSFGIFQPAGMIFIFFLFLDLFFRENSFSYYKMIQAIILLGLGMFTALLFTKFLPSLLLGETYQNTRSSLSLDILAGFTTLSVSVFLSLFTYSIKGGFFLVPLTASLALFGFFGLPEIKADKKRIFWVIGLILLTCLPGFLVSTHTAFRTFPALASIIFSLVLFGLIQLGQKWAFFQKNQKILGFMGIFLVLISVQFNLLAGIVLPQRAEYQAVRQAVYSLPREPETLLFFEPASLAPFSWGEFYFSTLSAEWASFMMATLAIEDLGLEEEIMPFAKNIPMDSALLDSFPKQTILVEDLFKVTYPNREPNSELRTKIKELLTSF